MADTIDPNDLNFISASNTDDLQEAPDPDAVAHPGGSDGTLTTDPQDNVDDSMRTYQDDLDYQDSATDPIMDELTEDPTKELQVPVDEFKDELDKIAFGDHNETGSEDMREAVEDREEDDDNAASSPQ